MLIYNSNSDEWELVRTFSSCCQQALIVLDGDGWELDKRISLAHVHWIEMTLTWAETSAGSPWAPMSPGWPGFERWSGREKEASK